VETVIGLRKVNSDLNEPPKAWLRSAIADLLPDWVMKRPKRGFTPPVREWHSSLLRAHGHSMTDGFLTSHGVLSQTSAQLLASASRAFDELAQLSFQSLVLEHWCRRMHP
jgi:asparagine synthase (glutamine-hydrolysing)